MSEWRCRCQVVVCGLTGLVSERKRERQRGKSGKAERKKRRTPIASWDWGWGWGDPYMSQAQAQADMYSDFGTRVSRPLLGKRHAYFLFPSR